MLEILPNSPRMDLASESPFRLGDLLVTPALLQVETGGQSLTLEPRVMQVLVVLAEEPGRVVSRADLVERCWDGRIVGENALQRVISRIRHLAATLGGFELETITKVGYRLRLIDSAEAVPAVAQAEPPEPASGRPISRRLVLGVVAGGIAAAGAAVAWRAIGADDPDAEAAKTLVRKGRDALNSSLREQSQQSIAYLKRATELDAESADAWGALALAYHRALDEGEGAEQAPLAEWTRSAARRALALDPANIDAKVALATIAPNFRNWAANEKILRALHRQHGSQQALEGALGWLLCDTGRWQEANGCFRRALAFEPFHPGNQLILAWGLWGSGNLEETDRILENALRLWPRHRSIWQTRFDFLATTGRPGAALAFVTDQGAKPLIATDQMPPPYATLQQVALALESGSAEEGQRATAAVIEARRSIGTIPVVTYLAALGQLDAAFAQLESFFFGGPDRPAPGPLSRRKTSILFSAKGAPLRRDPRYSSLTRRVGLDDYWRQTGTRPDKRR